MADKYRRMVPGENLRGKFPNAEFHNTLVQMVREYDAARSLRQGGFGVAGDARLRIWNTTDDTLDRYGVTGIGEPVTTPTENLDAFRDAPGFQSAAPVEDEPFAIIQEGILPDTIGTGMMSGVTQALVALSNITHTYAKPEADNYANLVSDSAATSCKILWSEIPDATTLDGAILSSDTTLTVASSEGYPEPDFVVTIGSEDLLVTSVEGEVWTVTRGHNSTTPAGHADGAAVTFKTGTVWAIVLMMGQAAGAEDNLPEILAAVSCF